MRAWVRPVYLSVMAALTVVYLVVPAGLPRGLLPILIEIVAVAALIAGGGVDRRRRAAWWSFAAAFGATLYADSALFWYQVHHQPRPFPSAADTGYLLGYVGMISAVALLQRGRPRTLASLVDAGIVTAGLGLVLWLVLGGRVGGHDATADLVALAYPVCDIALLALVVLLVSSPVTLLERGVLVSLWCGTAGTMTGDLIYGLSVETLDLQTRGLEVFYLVMYVSWGYAALRSAALPAAPAAVVSLVPSKLRLVSMLAALLVIPGSLLLHLRGEVDLVAVVVASVALSVLVPARFWIGARLLEVSTRQRDEFRDGLQHQAAHDPLTDLPNRAYLMELLTALVHRAARAGETVAVLFVDLDFFKRVNDSLGHAAGDEVLRITVERMKAVLRAGDVLSRQGGDEFVVLIDPVPDDLADLLRIAERLVAAVSVPAMTAAGRAQIGASVGVALARDAEVDAERLLQDADLAAYRAKTNGRGRVEIFDAALRAELEARARLEEEIRSGLAAGQFELHYQPVVAVPGGKLHGYEALIRWQHPERGLVPPNDFIPVAEESPLICEVGRWVLRTATRQLAAWVEEDPAGHVGVTVAVNISARHLASRTLVDEVRAALHESGLAAARLVLEITETALLDEPTADGHLRDLRALGVTVSLDDFGTGYTSIGQLQRLPVDTLKIDQSFLHSADPSTTALVQLMVTAAHAFGLHVVAEGVETREQLDRLAGIGCEMAQGFYLGRPARPEEIHPPVPVSAAEKTAE